MPERLAKKILLIGWDAADWQIINPLMDAGQMPALQRLVERGVMGNIVTLDPPFSPMLWTSIATGKTADQHGILGFVQPTDDGSSLRPVLGTSRKVKAFWNILNQNGLRSNVVAWWPSHPAEPIEGAMLSNFYHRSNKPIGEPWPLPEGAVHPPELAQIIEDLRVHPAELTSAHIAPFIPGVAEVDPLDDNRPSAIATMLSEAASIHAATTFLMENTEWDLTAVYLDTVDHFGHGFMKYHPPQQPHVSDSDFERYRHAITACYRFHDMMLDRLLDLAGDDTTVILLSDHGFHSDHLRLSKLPREPAAPALEHRRYGILAMAGPGIRKDERIYGASLLDITPTLLTLLGLPLGKDMAGKSLVAAFEDPPDLAYVDSWETIEGDDGMHTTETRSDPWAEEEAMRQLVELGYVEAPEGDMTERVALTRNETQFYLARVYLTTGRQKKALPILEALYAEKPDAERYALRLIAAYLSLQRPSDARRILDEVIARSEAQTSSDPASTADASTEPLVRPKLELLKGSVLVAEGKPEEARVHLLKAEDAAPTFPALHIRIGETYLGSQNWADAERALHKALAIDPDNAVANRGLALALLRQERYEEAARAALTAIGLQYHFPAAHFHLGEALMRLGQYEDAAKAFEVAVAQAPGMRRAHFWLAELYRVHLGEPEKAQAHLMFITERIRPDTEAQALTPNLPEVSPDTP